MALCGTYKMHLYTGRGIFPFATLLWKKCQFLVEEYLKHFGPRKSGFLSHVLELLSRKLKLTFSQYWYCAPRQKLGFRVSHFHPPTSCLKEEVTKPWEADMGTRSRTGPRSLLRQNGNYISIPVLAQ